MEGFGSTRTLRHLNVAAVGLSLAACTAALIGQLMHISGLATGPSTLLAGVAWALCMRSRKTVGNTPLRRGWLWSIPIAMANAGVACGVYLAMDNGPPGAMLGPFLAGLVFGPTMGLVVWLPALLLTLGCFGAPIAWSQRAAARGLAGEERGEVVVGAICTLFSLFGLWLAMHVPTAPAWWDASRYAARDHGLLFARLAAGLGLLTGLAAAVLGLVREAKRRAFVARVAAGDVAGFRVDDTREGRVLVRVTELGSGYRVANFTEELYALDETGDAARPLTQRGVA